MDSEEREIIERTLSLAEENNEILRKLHRAEKMRRIFRALYWLGIIALSLGAYYLIQPYVEQFRAAYEGISEGIENVRAAPSRFPDIEGFLKSLGGAAE